MVSARKVNRKMRDKCTFITRCLSAGICIFILIILVILADSPEESDGYTCQGSVKRLFWQSEEPCTKITWEESMLLLQYADGSDRTCTLSEILKDPAEAVYEKCMQIDYSVKEYAIDAEEYDDMTDRIYKEAYYGALSGQDMVRTRECEVLLYGF